MAGNARKVGAIRFERVNKDDATSETEVTRIVPKIMKRKWSRDDSPERGDYDEVSPEKIAEDGLSDGYVISEHEDKHEHLNKQ